MSWVRRNSGDVTKFTDTGVEFPQQDWSIMSASISISIVLYLFIYTLNCSTLMKHKIEIIPKSLVKNFNQSAKLLTQTISTIQFFLDCHCG